MLKISPNSSDYIKQHTYALLMLSVAIPYGRSVSAVFTSGSWLVGTTFCLQLVVSYYKKSYVILLCIVYNDALPHPQLIFYLRQSRQVKYVNVLFITATVSVRVSPKVRVSLV